MSWSISLIGSPENIVKALKENSEKLNGASKDEYDAALPSMIGMVEQNKAGSYPMTLHLDASGHASGDYSSCQFSIKNLGGQLV